MTEMQNTWNQELNRRQDQTLQQSEPENWERSLVPPVEIYEEDDALYLVADMPGVTKDALEIQAGNGVLELEGRLSVDMPENVTPLFAEVRASRYARRFTLGRDIDAANAEASVRDGVVTVKLPKQDSHKRKRIEINAA